MDIVRSYMKPDIVQLIAPEDAIYIIGGVNRYATLEPDDEIAPIFETGICNNRNTGLSNEPYQILCEIGGAEFIAGTLGAVGPKQFAWSTDVTGPSRPDDNVWQVNPMILYDANNNVIPTEPRNSYSNANPFPPPFNVSMTAPPEVLVGEEITLHIELENIIYQTNPGESILVENECLFISFTTENVVMDQTYPSYYVTSFGMDKFETVSFDYTIRTESINSSTFNAFVRFAANIEGRDYFAEVEIIPQCALIASYTSDDSPLVEGSTGVYTIEATNNTDDVMELEIDFTPTGGITANPQTETIEVQPNNTIEHDIDFEIESVDTNGTLTVSAVVMAGGDVICEAEDVVINVVVLPEIELVSVSPENPSRGDEVTWVFQATNVPTQTNGILLQASIVSSPGIRMGAPDPQQVPVIADGEFTITSYVVNATQPGEVTISLVFGDYILFEQTILVTPAVSQGSPLDALALLTSMVQFSDNITTNYLIREIEEDRRRNRIR